mmetsp:Transcript_19573/g.59210  ORF Transcript_19573/g.59210 Transcript_19573/m.59210 type:complete len:278 (-) Transcript_19573:2845-3678(-)
MALQMLSWGSAGVTYCMAEAPTMKQGAMQWARKVVIVRMVRMMRTPLQRLVHQMRGLRQQTVSPVKTVLVPMVCQDIRCAPRLCWRRSTQGATMQRGSSVGWIRSGAMRRQWCMSWSMPGRLWIPQLSTRCSKAKAALLHSAGTRLGRRYLASGRRCYGWLSLTIGKKALHIHQGCSHHCSHTSAVHWPGCCGEKAVGRPANQLLSVLSLRLTDTRLHGQLAAVSQVQPHTSMATSYVHRHERLRNSIRQKAQEPTGQRGQRLHKQLTGGMVLSSSS